MLRTNEEQKNSTDSRLFARMDGQYNFSHLQSVEEASLQWQEQRKKESEHWEKLLQRPKVTLTMPDSRVKTYSSYYKLNWKRLWRACIIGVVLGLLAIALLLQATAMAKEQAEIEETKEKIEQAQKLHALLRVQLAEQEDIRYMTERAQAMGLSFPSPDQKERLD